LFRSVASSYRDRAVGVILSGALSDGALGLAEIKASGGVAVVQDPADAMMAGMPESALLHVKADHVLPGIRIASEIVSIVEQCAGCTSANGHRIVVASRTKATPARDQALMLGNGQVPAGRPTPFTCPECGGALWERAVAKDASAFQCHVGHVYGEESLLVRQHETVDRAMWETVRSLEETVAFRREMAVRMRRRGMPSFADSFEEQAEQLQRRADVVRRALEAGLALPDTVEPRDGKTEGSATATAAFKKGKAGNRRSGRRRANATRRPAR
jgi:two-component system chemotaxis response regulator CheB